MINKIKTKIKNARVARAQILNAPSAFDDVAITWIAPEVVRHERGTVWKTIAALLVVLGAIAAFMYSSWSFGLAILACAVAYFLEHLEHPKYVDVKISEIGIKAGTRAYPYSKIKSFWIIYEPPYVSTLNLRVVGQYPGNITIQLDGQDPAAVREYLMSKIPELPGQSESLSDIFIRIFKI